jgi:magnesium-transporting ATPase (P-type)
LNSLGGTNHLLGFLETSIDKGIDPSSVSYRKSQYGNNLPILRKMKSFLSFVFECFEDLCLKILIVSAAVSLIVGTIEDPSKGWMEGVAILVTIIIVVSVTSLNNYLKEKKFQKLNEEAQERYVSVIRGHKEFNISIFELVVGDIIKVQSGDVMSVDCLVLWSMKLTADESSVTGEVDQMKKGLHSNESPFLLSGSQISDGNAIAVVLTVGIKTFLGKNLEKIMNVEESETPLQLKLNYIAELIGKVGLTAAALTLVVLLAYILADIITVGWESKDAGKIINSFIIAITIIVVAVPEGLPLAVTMSLAYSVNQMKKQNNLVRHLDASETMGQATSICSDKTGTLTQNIMKVVALYAEGTCYENLPSENLHKEQKDLLIWNFCHNTTASFGISDNKETFTGSRTEIALLKLSKIWGIDYLELRNPEVIVFQLPFNSDSKRMTTVVKWNKSVYLFVKGASEIILDLCRFYVNEVGEVRELDRDRKEDIKNNVIFKFANQAYRTLTFAYCQISNNDPRLDKIEENGIKCFEDNLIFQAIAGIEDPIRDGVPEAVSICQGAGITVRMVTGDNKETATAVAIKCGILPKNYNEDDYSDLVWTGEDFRTKVEGLNASPDNPNDLQVKNINEFKKIIKKMRVLARSSPEDKFILVTGLMQLNEVVAVTGDGSNDAPALKKSNVGFAMHLAGTQLAQEAADIILLDDNFSSILTAILWGRNIYDAICKFIQFQLTVNVIALLVCFIGSVVIEQTPLTAVQMLWVNLIMDSFAALALATEPPNPKLLKRSPVKHNDSLLTLEMIKHMTGQVLYQSIILTFILFLLPDMSLWLFDEEFDTQIGQEDWNPSKAAHFTIFFNTFVLMQVFNLISCKKLKSSEANVFKGFFNNNLFLFLFCFIIIVQFLIVEFGSEPANCVPLSLKQHIFCYLLGIGALIFGILFRFVPLRIFRCCKVPIGRINRESRGDFTSFIRRKEARSFLSGDGSLHMHG